MELFAFLSAEDVMPVAVFVAIVTGVFWLLSAISSRNSQAEATRTDRATEVAR